MRKLLMASAAGLIAMLSACAGTDEPATWSAGCVSWVDYETAEVAFDDADLVLVGTAAPTDTTVDFYGHAAAVHNVLVADVLKGSAHIGETLQVVATPLTCMGDDVYPYGDPLETTNQFVLFLHREDSDDSWRLITPQAGVVEVQPTGPTSGLVHQLKQHAANE